MGRKVFLIQQTTCERAPKHKVRGPEEVCMVRYRNRGLDPRIIWYVNIVCTQQQKKTT